MCSCVAPSLWVSSSSFWWSDFGSISVSKEKSQTSPGSPTMQRSYSSRNPCSEQWRHCAFYRQLQQLRFESSWCTAAGQRGGFSSIAGDVLHDFEKSKLTESREVKTSKRRFTAGRKFKKRPLQQETSTAWSNIQSRALSNYLSFTHAHTSWWRATALVL